MAETPNALAFGHDLWQRVSELVRAEYQDIEVSHQNIEDSGSMQMVGDPSQFQVIVFSTCSATLRAIWRRSLRGGLGRAPPGTSIQGRVSLFEPVHGSAPNIVEKKIANPMGVILTVGLMADYLAGRTTGARLKEPSERRFGKARLLRNSLAREGLMRRVIGL